MYKVSVIIPVYNAEKYLVKCLNNIVAQSLEDIEIIIIDDGSTDNSLNIIKKYCSKYENIKYKSKTNEGQAIARNIGISMATGEFITFVDSDDYIDKEMLEKMYNNAIENNSDIVVCDYVEEYERKKIYKKSLYVLDEDLKKSFIVSVAGPCSKIIKTEIFKRNNLKFLENNIYEDLAVIPVLAIYAKKITYCEEPLYHYVIRKNSTMQQQSYSEKLESIFNVMQELTSKFKNTTYKEELEFLYINHLLYAGIGRFIKYSNTEKHIEKIRKTIKSKYPKWQQNKYYKQTGVIYKLTCRIFYNNNKLLLKIYKKIRRG